jgi:hypothetical protein
MKTLKMLVQLILLPFVLVWIAYEAVALGVVYLNCYSLRYQTWCLRKHTARVNIHG